jgi:hypothetical protein
MMNYRKEGQGINGEIPKDGQQQTLCTSIVFMPIKAHGKACLADKLGLNPHCCTNNMINFLPMNSATI